MTKAILVSKTMTDPSYLDHLIEENEPKDISELTFFQQMKHDCEQLMIFIARVSSPQQLNPNYAKLLQYCWTHGHFSVFEQVNLTMEVETDMCTAMQLLRHRSLCFQQLSRRYSSDNIEFVKINARRQDTKNRQNTIDDLDDNTKLWFDAAQQNINSVAKTYYEKGLEKGLGKEILRYLLPQSLKTRLYVTGNLRNFIHYVNVRTADGVQLEHKDLANTIKEQLIKHFPVTSSSLGWIE